jgi:hypothetical protein
MKSIFNRVTGIMAAIIFVALIALFVLNLRQEQASSTNNTQGQSGYPLPQNAASQPAGYPGPPISYNQSNNSQSQNWQTYNGAEEIGFSFQYRSDFLLSTGTPSGQSYGKVRIVYPRVGASTISIFENPEQLSLEDFLESEDFLNGINFVWPNQWINTYPEQLTIAGNPSLGFQSHRDLIGLFGAAGYVIFVPFGDYIVQAALDGGGPTPDSGIQPYKSTDEAISLTTQILNSLQISTLPE